MGEVRIDPGRKIERRKIFKYVWFNRYLYLMLIPAITYYIVFHYLPMYGITIAFKNFSIPKGILGSPWAGLKHFKYLFSLDKFTQVFMNTLYISLYRLAFGFPIPIIAALLLNEIKKLHFKKIVQTVIYLPHFISWVILGGILINLLSTDSGAINEMIRLFGGEPIGFLTDEKYFRSTLVFSMIWKEYGWNTIIYMAALTGVDPELYEAATIDGSNRWNQVWHITLPCISSTIIVMFILRIGSLMEAGFDQIFVLYHPSVYRVADIIDTYVYRTGLTEGKYSLSSAVGVFKSVINFTLLIIANKLAKIYSDNGIF